MENEEMLKVELESLYMNIFILEEEVYLKVIEKIKKQKIYIMIGLNLKGYKDIIGIYIPEDETTSYWAKEFSELKDRGLKTIFMMTILKNDYIKRGVKLNYQDVIYAPSMLEIYNKSYNYISRKQHRIVTMKLSRLYKQEKLEEAKKIYEELLEEFKDNKLLIMIISKYINEIFGMFKYSKRIREMASNTDTYVKMRCRIRWNIKKKKVYNSYFELKEYVINVLKEEYKRWGPSKKGWDLIINSMDCDLLERIYELI